MAKLTGTNPGQVPTNADLGTMAYQDKDNVSINGGSINLKDNDKIQLGDSSDLQIYHDGSSSYITDAGTGNLRIQATNLVLQNAAGTKNYLIGIDGGATQFYFNNSEKLATTSSGIDVTGTVTATSYAGDGSALTGVGGLQTVISTTTISSAASVVNLSWSNTGYKRIRIELNNVRPSTNGANLYMRTSTTAASSFHTSNNYWGFGIEDGRSDPFTQYTIANTYATVMSYIIGNSTNEGVFGDITFLNPFETGAAPAVSFNLIAANTSNAMIGSQGGFKVNDSAAISDDIDGMQLYFSSGNVASGVIRVVGIVG